jgi:diguanylate cyclase (GGDEF)-like protein
MVGAQMVEQARRQGDAVHCLFVDIDGLKRVNERAGHAVGDEVIVAVAEALRAATRGTDVVARWGGDEFCVVGPGPGTAPLELERRVRDGVVLASEVPAEVWPVRVSAGGSMLAPWDSGTLETLLGKADQEMYLRRSLRKEASALPHRRASADSPPANDAERLTHARRAPHGARSTRDAACRSGPQVTLTLRKVAVSLPRGCRFSAVAVTVRGGRDEAACSSSREAPRMSWSRATKRKAGLTALAAATALTVGVGVSVVAVNAEHNREQSEPRYVGYLEKAGGEAGEEAEREREAGGHPEGIVGGASSESGEIATALDSVANARLAPYGSVAAGQYSASLGSFTGLGSSGAAWNEVTNTPYDADDPAYRDPNYSNSSGGAGYVAGRITGLAAGNGWVFAGGANGGVFRKSLGGDKKPGGGDDSGWQPISDDILSLSTGDLVYDAGHDTLWYATGEANTGGTSYTGAGVYRLENASTGRSPRPTASVAPSSRAAASTSSRSAAATCTPPAPEASGGGPWTRRRARPGRTS